MGVALNKIVDVKFVLAVEPAKTFSRSLRQKPVSSHHLSVFHPQCGIVICGGWRNDKKVVTPLVIGIRINFLALNLSAKLTCKDVIAQPLGHQDFGCILRQSDFEMLADLPFVYQMGLHLTHA